jgi:hypothetical protein
MTKPVLSSKLDWFTLFFIIKFIISKLDSCSPLIFNLSLNEFMKKIGVQWSSWIFRKWFSCSQRFHWSSDNSLGTFPCVSRFRKTLSLHFSHERMYHMKEFFHIYWLSFLKVVLFEGICSNADKTFPFQTSEWIPLAQRPTFLVVCTRV